MKLTIEIDDRHTGDLIQFLASLQGNQVEETEPEDPTQHIVPIPARMFPLPPLPYGYSHWVGRGCIRGVGQIGTGIRIVWYFDSIDKQWIPTENFYGTNIFHIEAIK